MSIIKPQNSRAYNFLKRGCGDRTLDATAVAAITTLAIDGSTKINDILDIIRESEVRGRAVTANGIGKASDNRA